MTISLPSNSVLVIMTLVFLCFPSSSVPSSEEDNDMSPICNDKKHFESGQGISFSSSTNSSNNLKSDVFEIDGPEPRTLFVGKARLGFENATYRLVNKSKL